MLKEVFQFVQLNVSHRVVWCANAINTVWVL